MQQLSHHLYVYVQVQCCVDGQAQTKTIPTSEILKMIKFLWENKNIGQLQ